MLCLIPVIFNTVFMVLNVVSVCVAVGVLNLHHKQSDVPSWVKRVLHLKCRDRHVSDNKVEMLQRTANNERSTDTMSPSGQLQLTEHEITKQCNHGETVNKTWKDVANAINSILFMIYILAALVMSCICLSLWVKYQ